MTTLSFDTLRFAFLNARCLVVTLSLLTGAVSHARYVATEGSGYTLCERIAAHVNRLTENGRAPKFWTFMEKEPRTLRFYPESQTYLTRELLSYPGFERPSFKEIKLEDARGVIDLIGELDRLGGGEGLPFGYGSSDDEYKRYLADRKAGLISDETAAKITRGSSLYEHFKKGRARVFTLRDESLSPNTVMQIEFYERDGEPVSMLRVVNNELTEPRLREGILDFHLTGRGLVRVNGNYYVVHGNANSFEVESASSTVSPHLCRVGRLSTPKLIKYPKRTNHVHAHLQSVK